MTMKACSRVYPLALTAEYLEHVLSDPACDS